MLYDWLVLRRTKDILELPGQDVRTREIELSPGEKEQYKRTTNILSRRIRQLHGALEGEDKFGLFQAQLQLRILCNHGTWQKLFSWKKRDIMEEHEAHWGEVGADAEATCAGCKQPRPILGSNMIYNQFVEKCGHMLCSECLEDCGGENITHCPLCKRFRKTDTAAEVSTPLDGSDEDTAMPDAEDYLTVHSTKKKDDYFNFQGHSTKMEALVDDVRVDLQTTKRCVRFRFTRMRKLRIVSQHYLLLLDPNSGSGWDLPPAQPDTISSH